MPKTLIVYYSRDGNTKKVAEKLAEQMSCDIIQITESKSRKGILGFLKAGMEASRKTQPPIILPEINLEDYELFLIGTPIWAGAMASPVRTFMVQKLPKTADYAIFYTRGGAGDLPIGTATEKIVGKAPKVVVGIGRKEMISGKWESKLNSCTDLA